MNNAPSEDTISLTPLAHVATGSRVIVSCLTGGRRLDARLADLGILPGVCVEVLRKGGNGPVIVASRGSRMAIGCGMAAKVLVRRGR